MADIIYRDRENNISKQSIDKWGILARIALILGALISVFPFIWMLLGAFKPQAELDRVPPTFIPQHWILDNLKWVWTTMQFPRAFGNSMIVTTIATASTLYTSALIGYVLAKFKFRGRELIFFFIISQMFIPGQSAMIVRWYMLHNAGMLNNLFAVMLPSLYSVFGIFLLRQNMHSIPDELLDAARMDGASEIYIFHKIVLPNLGPVLSALGIFTFLWVYDDYLWPLLVLNKQQLYTVPLALAFYQGQYFNNVAQALAGASVAVLPTLIVFLIFQKYIVEGMVFSGLKG